MKALQFVADDERFDICFGVQIGSHGEPGLGAQLPAAVHNGTCVETHHPDRDPQSIARHRVN